jgi:hypothetical protein
MKGFSASEFGDHLGDLRGAFFRRLRLMHAIEHGVPIG